VNTPAIPNAEHDPDANFGSMIFDALRASVKGEIGGEIVQHKRGAVACRLWGLVSSVVVVVVSP